MQSRFGTFRTTDGSNFVAPDNHTQQICAAEGAKQAIIDSRGFAKNVFMGLLVVQHEPTGNMVQMMSKTQLGIVFQINVKPETPGERGLPKYPTQRALVTRTGLGGDFNRWRHEEAHDDLAMAVLLMPLETIAELKGEGWPIGPGDVGENFTTQGIPYNSFAPGKHYRIGEAVIMITKPCDPCSFLYALPNIGKDKDIVKALHNRRGWYASVEIEGWVAKGDSITEVSS